MPLSTFLYSNLYSDLLASLNYPLEAYAHAAGRSFTMEFSRPGVLESFFCRERKDCKRNKHEVKFFKNGQLVFIYVIDSGKFHKGWNFRELPKKVLADTIIFPDELDFDNIFFAIKPSNLLREFKLNYAKQLLNNEKRKLGGNIKNGKLLKEAADMIAQKFQMYKVKLDYVIKENDTKDPVITKLLDEIKKVLSKH